MASEPSKKQETYNIDETIGKKGQQSEISSSDASWSTLVFDQSSSMTGQPGVLAPEQVKEIFGPINQAVEQSEPARLMRDRVNGWISELMKEAMKGPDINAEIIDNNIGNLYFFCEDIFKAAYDVFTMPDSLLNPAFRLAAETYKGK